MNDREPRQIEGINGNTQKIKRGKHLNLVQNMEHGKHVINNAAIVLYLAVNLHLRVTSRTKTEFGFHKKNARKKAKYRAHICNGMRKNILG